MKREQVIYLQTINYGDLGASAAEIKRQVVTDEASTTHEHYTLT
jgi:hypothetical protein